MIKRIWCKSGAPGNEMRPLQSWEVDRWEGGGERVGQIPRSEIGSMQLNWLGKLPGPLAPPDSRRPRRKMTARSYSCTT